MKSWDREANETFAEESATRLSRIADHLELLAKSRPVDMAVVHGIFRDTHSLKSAANLLGQRGVEQIAHKLEDILDKIRSGSEEPDEQLVEILGAGYARIGQLIKNPHILRLIDVGKDIAAIDRLLLARRSEGVDGRKDM
jgi:two-component system chemotaxis sensor kinase CheA